MASRPNTRSSSRNNQTSSTTQQVNSNQVKAVKETPRTIRTDGRKTGVNKLRQQIGMEMDQEFVECSFNNFMNGYLPFAPEKADVTACLARLREATTPDGEPILRQSNFGTDEKPDLRECLADFHGPMHTTEAQLFSRMDGIADVIAESQINGRELHYQFYDCHTRIIKSDIEGSTNEIDACFPPVEYRLPKAGEARDSTHDELHTSIIPVVCEWKLRKGHEEKRENSLQVVSANVQIMNADASRMFSFGMTIEGDELRLWYFSRSHSAVSKAVDFVRNPAFLVKAFMSFMFATRTEMGYDPTVTRHAHDTYTYSIPSAKPGGDTRFFRTIKVISEYRSNNVTGRMARVWLVKEVRSSAKDAKPVGSQYVLKDVWLEESAQTELQLQDEIFESIDNFWSSPPRGDKKELKELWDKHHQLVKDGGHKDFFLTIAADYEGQRSKPVAKGAQKRQGLFSAQDIYAIMISRHGSTSDATHTRSGCGQDRDVHIPGKMPEYDRVYARKKQYRLIFEEECVPFGQLEKLGDAFDVLQQTLIPLELLLCAGWVHRDISSGNILAYKQEDGSWKAKLSDLEYAKKFPLRPKPTTAPTHDLARDPKTGTPYFMAHEILQLCYLIHPKDPQDSLTVDDVFRTRMAPGANPPRGMSTVIHNYQHDLEAMYWLFLWTLVDRIPYKPSHRYSKKIFSNWITPSVDRTNAFVQSVESRLREVLKPSIAVLAVPLDIIRGRLHDAYVSREEAIPVCLDNPCAYIKIYNDIWRCFELIAKGRSAWANEILSSRHEIGLQFQTTPGTNQRSQGASSQTHHQGQPGGTSSAPGRAKRRRASQVHPTDSRGSRHGSRSLTSSALADDDWRPVSHGSRSAKRHRTKQ